MIISEIGKDVPSPTNESRAQRVMSRRCFLWSLRYSHGKRRQEDHDFPGQNHGSPDFFLELSFYDIHDHADSSIEGLKARLSWAGNAIFGALGAGVFAWQPKVPSKKKQTNQ